MAHCLPGAVADVADNDDEYRTTVRELSDRLVDLQGSIRVLNAVRWDDEIEAAFFAAGCREQPPVTVATYEANPLGFDPDKLVADFQDLAHTISSRLGRINPAAVLLLRRCDEYTETVRMLDARGTPEFTRLARQLYGATTDAFHVGGPNLVDLSTMLDDALDQIDLSELLEADERDTPAVDAVDILQARLDRTFDDPDVPVHVQLADELVADAAAGSDYIKLRSNAVFSQRDLRLLEAHEGWVHVGTTMNGRLQPWCTFLSKGPPSTTITQEGLAVLVEITSFRSHPARLRRVNDRVHAVNLAEDGATFLDVFEFFRTRGLDEHDCYALTARVFRGSLPTEGPFPKDLAYSRGFVSIYNFLRVAVRKGRIDRIPLLFCGKTTLENVGLLGALWDEGMLVPPRFLPPQFEDFHGLAAWLAYSNFFNQLEIEQLEADYATLLVS